jgi:hypothetical protein
MKSYIITILLSVSAIQTFSQADSRQDTTGTKANKNKLQVKNEILPVSPLQNRPDTLRNVGYNYAVAVTSSGLEKDGNMNLFKDLTAGLGNASTIGGTDNSSVNPYTGKLNVSVPLYTFQSKSISVPISLNYSTDGVNLAEVPSQVGNGWQLNVGGKISRKMNGFPDEEKRDKLILADNKVIKAYGYLTLPSEGLLINNWANYTDSQRLAFIQWISWKTNPFIATKAYDAEPDEFYYNVGGFSGKFVFDQLGGIMQIPKTNVKIMTRMQNYTVGGTTRQKIYGFDIITPDGTKYIFGNADLSAVEEKKLTSLGFTIDFMRRAKKNKDIPANVVLLGSNFPTTNDLNKVPLYTVSNFSQSSCPNGINDTRSDWFASFGLPNSEGPNNRIPLENQPYSIGFMADIKSFDNCGILTDNTLTTFYYEPMEFLYDATPRLNLAEVGEGKWDFKTKYRYEVLHDNYTTDWYLVSIISPDDDRVNFEYETITTKYLLPRHFSISGPLFSNTSTISSLPPVIGQIDTYVNSKDVFQFFHPTNLQLGTNYVFSEDKKKLIKKITNKFGHYVEFFNTNNRTDLIGGKTLDRVVVNNGSKQVKAWALNYDYKEALGNYDKAILAKGTIANETQLKTFDLNDKVFEAFKDIEGITKEDAITKYTPYFTTEQSWLFLRSITEIDNRNITSVDKYKFEYEYANRLPRRGTVTESEYGFTGIGKPAVFGSYTNSFEIFSDRTGFPTDVVTALKTGLLTSYKNNLGGKVGITYEVYGETSTRKTVRAKELIKYPDANSTDNSIKETYLYGQHYSSNYKCLNADGTKITPEKLLDYNVQNLSPNNDTGRPFPNAFGYPPFTNGIIGKSTFQVFECNFYTSSQNVCLLNQTGGGWYGHEKVTISQTGNGKKVIDYISPQNMPDANLGSVTYSNCSILPTETLGIKNRRGKALSELELFLVPKIDLDWKRGFVSNETVYRENGDPISKITNVYKFKINDEENTVVKGILCDAYNLPASKISKNISVFRQYCDLLNLECGQIVKLVDAEKIDCGGLFQYYSGAFYNIESNFPNLEKTISESYFYEGTTSKTVSKEVSYQYGSKHLLPTKVTESNTGTSDVLESISVYPDDLYNFAPLSTSDEITGDPYAIKIMSMIEQNMINYPIETTRTKGGKVIESVYNEYDLQTGSNSNAMVLLTKRYTSKKDQAYTYLSSTTDPEGTDNFKRAFYNVTIEEVPESRPSFDLLLIPPTRTVYNFEPLFRSDKYFILPEVNYDYYSNGNLRMMTTKGYNKTTYLWSYKNYLPVAEIQNATYNTVQTALGSSNIVTLGNSVDDSYITSTITGLRGTLGNTMIKSYTFDPLIGITKSYDFANMSTRYEYDNFNRLIKVFDNDSKLVKSYQYNYMITTLANSAPDITFSGEVDVKDRQINLSFAYPKATVVKYEIRRGQGNEPMKPWVTVPGDNNTKIDPHYTPQQNIYNYGIKAILSDGTATEWKSLNINIPNNCAGKLQIIKNGLILTSKPVYDKACYEIILDEGFETQDNAEYTGEIEN